MLHLTKKTPTAAGCTGHILFPAIMRKAAQGLICVTGALAVASAMAQNPAPGTAPIAAPGTAPVATTTAAALAPGTGPKYDNRFEAYAGFSFMNGQAGQDLPTRYNMGGGEGMFTYWLGHGPVGRLGVAADYRFEAGTTPTEANPGNNQTIHLNRVLVMQSIYSGGVQYRGFRNRYIAIDYHALAGESDGIFDHATTHYPGGSPVSACPAQEQPGQVGSLGLYCDHYAPWGAAGGSIDFNYSNHLAVRLSPDMIFEHFGTETREFFSISMGAVYRFGKR